MIREVIVTFWTINDPPGLQGLIGIILDNGKAKIFILNVYLLCEYQHLDALDKYIHSLATIEAGLRGDDIHSIIVIIVVGDFNTLRTGVETYISF